MSVCISVCASVCLSVCLCVEDSGDQSTVGPWPPVGAAVLSAATLRSAAALPPVDSLTIDSMDELPDIDQSCDSVSQLSKTLIEFLLTRQLILASLICLI